MKYKILVRFIKYVTVNRLYAPCYHCIYLADTKSKLNKKKLLKDITIIIFETPILVNYCIIISDC